MATMWEKLKSEWKTGIALVLILALSAGVRFHVLEIHRDNRELHESSSRTQASMAEARKLIRGDWSGVFPGQADETKYRADDVGFAVYIAAVWSLVEDRTLNSVQAGTVWFDLVALVLVVFAVRRAFTPGAGILAGLLYALYLPIPIQIAHANNHVLVVQFAVVLISLLILLPQRGWFQWGMLFLAAVVFLFANLVRSVFGPFAFLCAFFLFLRYGKRRGLTVGLTFLALTLGGNLVIKQITATPSHQVWHSLFVGLGEFPNPYGLIGYDTEGNEEAGRIRPGVDMYRNTPEYLEIIKFRTLSLIDENRDFYVRSLAKRTINTLVGFQDWFFVGFGPKHETSMVISWVLFLAGAVGMVLAYLRKRWDGLLFFMGWGYFSLCVVPLLTTIPAYYLAGSALLIPFPAYFLANLRFRGGPDQPVPVNSPWASDWRIERWTVGFIAVSALLAVVGTGVFLAYARGAAKSWEGEMVSILTAEEPGETWGPSQIGKITPYRDEATIPLIVETPNRPHLLHLTVRVKRGRLGMEVTDLEGNPAAPPVYSAGLGENHCFLSWTPTQPGEARLHLWEALPRDYPDYYDENEGAFRREAFDHHGMVDLAKLEYFPENSIEVSASFFPNGHPTMPYLLNKRRPGKTETSVIPNYWASSAPGWTRVTLSDPHEIDQVVCRIPAQGKPVDPPTLALKHKIQPNFRTPTGLSRDVSPDGREIRFRFNRTETEAIEIRFETAGNDLGIAYLQDVSVPIPADFEILGLQLRVRGTSSDAPPYPTSLSFQAPVE